MSAQNQTQSSQQTVAIVGASGALGSGLSIQLAKAGVRILAGSRDLKRAEEAVERLREQVPGGDFTPLVNADAAAAAEIVIFAVPFRNHSETLTNLKPVLKPGQIVVDTTVPLAAAVSGKATRTIGVWQGSAAQQAEEMVPEGVTVISALHTVSAAALAKGEVDEDVLICGDSREAKTRVAALIDLIPGLRCVDCGRLEMSRIVEQLTAMLISVNIRNKTHAGIRLTNLPEKLW